MRIAVLIVGIVGALSAGLLGLSWMGSERAYEEAVRMAESLGMTAEDLEQSSGVSAGYAKRCQIASYFLLLSLPAGVAGAVMAFRLKAKPAAVVLGAAGIVPAFLVPSALVFTFFLLVGAALSFFIKPAPARA